MPYYKHTSDYLGGLRRRQTLELVPSQVCATPILHNIQHQFTIKLDA